MKNEKVYLLTDGCMWEKNKREGASHPHAIEVVDTETGAVQYITSGSVVAITLIKGKITDIRTQEAYNKATSKTKNMPVQRKGLLRRKGGKAKSKDNK